MVTDDRLRRIRRKLDTMPEAEAQVFKRARFRDLSYLEIAGELGISVAEVERRMARAMLHLVSD